MGTGAHGEVYAAEHPRWGLCAVKLLHQHLSEDQDLVLRFRREATLSAGIDHPHVLPCLDHGQHGGRLYQVSPLLAGGSLEDLAAARGGRMAWPELLPLARQVVAGLQVIHARGLVHRDLKPANVLLDAQGVARIADLGLARSVADQRTRLTMEGMILGSPAFLAPEQIDHGESIDGRADCYSLGCMLYFLLSGEVPYPGSSVINMLHGHLSSPLPRLRRLLPDLPADIDALVADCMVKDPARRPDAAALFARLDALVHLHGLGEGALLPTLADGAGPPIAPTMAEGALPGTLPDGGIPTTLPDAPVPSTLGDDPALKQAPSLLRVAEDWRPHPPQLCLSDANGQTTFIIAGSSLTLGRDAVDVSANDCCLRLFPARERAADSRRISGRHCTLQWTGTHFSIADHTSQGGTRLRGAPLTAGEAQPVSDGDRLELAGVLELRLRLLTAAAVRIADSGQPLAQHALLIERVNNGSSHRYLLLPGLSPWPDECSDALPLVHHDGGLGSLGSVDGTMTLQPLFIPPGYLVRHITPDLFKDGQP